MASISTAIFAGKEATPTALRSQLCAAHPAMADHTPTKSETKKAEEAADQVVAAFSQALDSAFEAEVEYIADAFRKNRGLTHCLSGMLKAYTIQSLLDGRLRGELSANASGAQPARSGR